MRFIPIPNENESEDDYVSRCIPIVIEEGTAKDISQAAVICHNMWREKHKQNNESKDAFMQKCIEGKPTDMPDNEKRAACESEWEKQGRDDIPELPRTTPSGGDGGSGGRSRVDKPFKGESKEAFMVDCIFKKYPLIQAVCEEEWKKFVEEPQLPDFPQKPQPSGGDSGQDGIVGQNKKQGNRVLMHLCSSKLNFSTNLDKPEKYNIDRSTILVGDGTYNGVFFPAEEIEKAHLTWNKQPLNLDHSDKVEDIVGYVTEAFYDKNTKKFSVKPIIDAQLPKSIIARGYINSRLDAGSIPEVSVGVWVGRVDESLEEGKTRLTARNLMGDHLALVTRGACSPQDGCGIGLKNDSITVTLNEKGEYEDEIKKLELKIEIEKQRRKK